jgi:hypothetical protein
MTMPIPVTHPDVLRRVLQDLVERIDHSALHCGVEPALLDELRLMPARDLGRLAQNTRRPWLGLVIDGFALRDSLDKENARRQEWTLESYFHANGAQPELIARLFKLPLDEVRKTRSTVLPEGATPGRPRLPPIDERPAICTEWARLQQLHPSHPTRQLLRRLHQAFNGYSIQALWTVINEFKR